MDRVFCNHKFIRGKRKSQVCGKFVKNGLMYGGTCYTHSKRRKIQLLCEHGIQKQSCVECGGSAICQHDKQRQGCSDCYAFCILHGEPKESCKQCYQNRPLFF